MAYSSVIIDFTSVPVADTVINLSESLQGLNLNELFKAARSTAGEVAIPISLMSRYEMNIPSGTDISNIDVRYTSPAGGFIRVGLNTVEVIDELDGTYTYVIDSSSDIVFVNRTTNGEIVWTYDFTNVGPADGYFTDYISDNFKTAFDLDYNTSSLYTVTSTVGSSNSGLGVVVITANYYNAVFAVLSNTSLATITISNESYVEPSDFVSPSLLNFTLFGSFETPVPQNLNITTTGTWEVTSIIPAWLTLSAVSGSGNATIQANVIYSESLPEGETAVDVAITVGAEFYTVSVVLTVIRFVKVPFRPGNLYFTQELEYLRFGSATAGTFVEIDIEITIFKINTNKAVVYNRLYKFPLFKGKGDFHVGTIVHGLLEEIENLSDFVPNFDSNYYKNQMRPAEVVISFVEKSFGAVVPGLVSGNIPMFKMTKGHKPFMTTGQLALLTVAQQDIIRITPQSYIGTSFVYFGTPRIIVKKNNVIIEDFEIVPTPNEVIYSYYRFINDMKPGDSIDLIVVNGLETRSQRFLVFMNGLENTYFFFENDNGVVEPYEFSGRRRLTSTLKHSTTAKFKDLYSYNDKVKTDISQSLIVNTGQLAKADHRVITALASSTKVWCSMDDPKGPYFRVDSTTTKIMNQDTSGTDESFDIEFNLLENANASIYPR